MKKILLTLAAIVGVSTFSTQAQAGCDGIYLAARSGIVNHNLGNPDETMGDRFNVDDNAWIGSGAIGYRWGYFRAELEGIWRDSTVDKVKDSIYGIETEFETYSYMLNLYYDFSPYTMFTPFASAGIGMSHIEFNYSNNLGYNKKVETDNFTWAIGGGISAKVTNRFNVDVGYRFMNMGEIEKASVRAHEVYAGLRYVF